MFKLKQMKKSSFFNFGLFKKVQKNPGQEPAYNGFNPEVSLVSQISDARFLIHVGGGVNASFHVDLWNDYINAVDVNSILMVRSKSLFRFLRTERPDLRVICIENGYQAEWLVSSCPKLAAILYVSNTGDAIHFLRFNHLTHVWLGHGDSEKASSCYKFFRSYDEIWCAGRAQIDRFRNSGMAHESLSFRVVGRPTLRKLIKDTLEPKLNEFLYLPTWEGYQADQEYSSIVQASNFLLNIVELTGRNALVKLHPWTGQRVSLHHDIEKSLSNIRFPNDASIQVLSRRLSAVELMPSASFLVADVSSVVSDFLLTVRPIFLYMPSSMAVSMSASAMPMESYCYVFRTEEELTALIQNVIVDGNDYLEQSRIRARDYFVDTSQTINDGFEGALRDLIDRHDYAELPWSGNGLQSPEYAPSERPVIIGHRGAKLLYPENSISGFEAVTHIDGLDAVEFDLHMSSDGYAVVVHDPTLDRTTADKGWVSLRTMKQLRELRLKGLNSEDNKFLDEGIPSFDDVLDVLEPTKLSLFIELKNNALGESYPDLPSVTLDALRSRDLLDRCTITSFSPNVLENVRHLDRHVSLLASVNYRSIEMMGGLQPCLERFGRIAGCGVALDYVTLNRLRDAGVNLDYRRFGVWVVNTSELILQVKSLGVKQIFTDRPDLAVSIFSEEGARK